MTLHQYEEDLRHKAVSLVQESEQLRLHLSVIEKTMDLADMLRQAPNEDEDFKVIRLLSMRVFNAFAASIKLSLSGYSQNAALIMRDVLETVFLLDLFRTDWSAVERWRYADDKARKNEFAPVRVRKALDARDGFEGKKRAEHYKLLSELAGHPTMKSVFMMRPKKDGDAAIGPFIEAEPLEAIVSEMGKLAVITGETIDLFFPAPWTTPNEVRLAFARAKRQWGLAFYSAS